MPNMSISKEELVSMIAAAVAAAKTERKAKGKKTGRKLLTEEEKTEKRAKIDAQTVTAFEKQGYKDIKPRENVRTFNKWIENGRRVKKGEKSTKCGSWPLFHYDQTEALTLN
jgi:hypothetical protein